jgi:hypothetical protein
VVWKKVNNADPGTSTKFGGNDLDKISDLFSGTDVDDLDINSDTAFRQDKLQVRNSANTFGSKFRTNATAARTITFPDQDLEILESLSPFSYVIYKEGSTYYAKSKNLTDYSSTNANTVLKAVGVALQTAGGGLAYLKDGEYIIPDQEAPIDNIENTVWIGESRDKTIIRGQNTLYPPFYRIGTGNVPTWSLYNLTIQMENDQSAIYLGGSKDCVFENCRFKRTVTPSVASFIVFFDDVSKTRTHQRLRMNHCIVEGNTNAQDMLGSGEFYGCDMSYNSFLNSINGQGLACNRAVASTFSNNYFYNVGNPIGLENKCEGNVINGNRLENCLGFLKLSFNVADEASIGNRCCNNTIFYGDSGIQDYAGKYDLIEGNFIYRTKTYGIIGAFDHSVIANNQIIETNYSGTNITMNAVGYKQGGIVLNNNSNFTTNHANRIYGNVVRALQPAFTVPTGYLDGGTSKTGQPGGILCDSNNLVLQIHDNDVEDTLSRIVVIGTAEMIQLNRGFVTEGAGTATIASGQTSVAVNHGLHITPVLHHILATPSNNLGNATKFWISNPTSTQFTINVNTDPGASTATFVWRAQRNV